jgi:potassium-transporting ATPase KdpC subunit
MSDEKKPSWTVHVRPLIGLAIISLILAGLFFPFLMTGVGQALFPNQANGDLVYINGRVVGSYYVDNGFTLPIFFHGRYENASEPQNSSASLVDPDITIAQAYAQIPRISNSTGISATDLENIVNNHEEGTFWIFGSPYVNVLNLNVVLIYDYPTVYANFTK